MTKEDQEYNYTPLEKPLRITDHQWPEGTVPLVSIRCITYNHVNFIRDAIEGFLMQETAFPVEILIHDDASADGTTEIIQEYEKKYPSLISAYCQRENTYRHPNRKELRRPFFEAIKGEYVATCEGDDFWISRKKLQRQIECLTANESVDLCFHPAKVIDFETKQETIKGWNGKTVRIVPAEKVITGGGGFIPTASIVYRKKIRDEIRLFKEEYGPTPVGDYVTQVIGSFRGGALYLPYLSSVYRKGVPGSWSVSMKTNLDAKNLWALEAAKMHISLNKFSCQQFSFSFNISLFKSIFKKLCSRSLTLKTKARLVILYLRNFIR